MDISNFPTGTVVFSAKNKSRKGRVIGVPQYANDRGQLLAIEWGDGALERVRIDNLLTEKSLEDEFKAVQDEINGKLQEAAKLIKEAASLAEAHGKDLRSFDTYGEDYLFDQGLLEDAMEEAGWNTSSWHC